MFLRGLLLLPPMCFCSVPPQKVSSYLIPPHLCVSAHPPKRERNKPRPHIWGVFENASPTRPPYKYPVFLPTSAFPPTPQSANAMNRVRTLGGVRKRIPHPTTLQKPMNKKSIGKYVFQIIK